MPDTPIDADGVHLWLAYYDELADAAVLARLGALLSEQEHAQQRRFLFADDRTRYLVTRALLRSVLSLHAPVAAADWTFELNAWGRPAIAAAHRAAAGELVFNISHARGLVVIAVARHREVGVDVENLVHRPVSTAIADRFFSAAEVAELATVPPGRRQDRFFEYWTLKESYIKARGMGLSLPLDQFGFVLDEPGTIGLRMDPALADDPARWCFLQYRPSPEHLLALCLERRSGKPPVVAMHRMTPAGGFEDFDTPLLKASPGAA